MKLSPYDESIREANLALFFGTPPDLDREFVVEYYKVTDEKGLTLLFSLSYCADSVRTELIFNSQTISTSYSEGANFMEIEKSEEGSVLRVDFTTGTADTVLRIAVSPEISVQWATLVRR